MIEKREELSGLSLKRGVFLRISDAVNREDRVKTRSGRLISFRLIVISAGICDIADARHQVGKISRPDPVFPEIGMVIVTVQNQIIRILEVLVISAISFEFDKDVVEANNISQNVFCCCRHLVRIPAILRIPDFC